MSPALEAALAARGEVLDPAAASVYGLVADCISGLADFQSLEPSITATAQPGTTAPIDPALEGGGSFRFVNLAPPTTTIEVRRNGTPIARAVVPLREGAATTVTFNYPQFL
jgi:hypothetical protein